MSPKPTATTDKKKPSGPRKTWTLEPADLKKLNEHAEAGDDFAISLKAGYEEYGSLSDKQYDGFQAYLKRLEDAPKLKTADGKSVPVIIFEIRDGRPVCIQKGCKELAKVAIPSRSGKAYVGVCVAHAEEES